VRMDRLEEQGLVERRADPDDRRNSLIVLTAKGRSLFERVVPAHLANERRLLVGLAPAEQALLATLLRKLLVEYEGSRPAPAEPFRLGVTVAPAHVTIAMRAAVGLEPTPGLLVRHVADDSPARAALRPGDVLVRAGARHLTSVASLYAAIVAAGAGPLALHVLRGSEAITVAVPLDRAVTTSELARAATPGRAAGDRHVV